ncbi:MAG: ATP-binding protein [Cytophagales bacterium]|nr:MAG: ATP-binding protein [Cytophagales bacterium]
MNIDKFVSKIADKVNQDSGNLCRKKFSALQNLAKHQAEWNDFLYLFQQATKRYGLIYFPPLEEYLDANTLINFTLSHYAQNHYLEHLAYKEEIVDLPTAPLKAQEVPDDFIKYLFDFESPQEYERFQASLDSPLPVGIFLIPMKYDFYTDVLERILSYEILRKRQYHGDSRVGEMSHVELSRFTDSDEQVGSDGYGNDNIWSSMSDIFHFNTDTMQNVILGQSAIELIESEKLDKKFRQLSLYSNKYYSSGQFFILFHCPPLPKIIRGGRLPVLEKLFEHVVKKFPYTFKLQCRYDDEKDIPLEVKKMVSSHLKFLLEVPSYEANWEEDSMSAFFSEMQQVGLHAERTILLDMQIPHFQKLNWYYETDEFAYLQYFAVNTLHHQYQIPLDKIHCGTSISRKYDDGSEPEITADVRAGLSIIVEIETLIRRAGDKNVYLSLLSSLKNDSKAYPATIKELWIVMTGFEIARNYYQIKKMIELLSLHLQEIISPEVRIQVMMPDYVQRILVPVTFDRIAQPEIEVKSRKNFINTREQLLELQPPILKFDNVKGLYEEKELLKDLITLQNENHALGLGGILFYGLPGCGKTYLSNAFANELDRNFFSFSPADIQSIWIGQSQKNLKDIFSQARSKSPSLLFLDELDSIGFSRGEDQAHTDQKATINQLLMELNNLDENDMLVIGATNRLNSLDVALKRSGRFDLKIPIFPPSAHERAEIFEFYVNLLNKELHTKKRTTLEIDKVYYNYIGEESIGFTSSDVKLLVNQLRIDNLLNKSHASDKNGLIRRIKKFIKEGQRSLHKEDVLQFILECEANDNYSPKIEILRHEWNL